MATRSFLDMASFVCVMHPDAVDVPEALRAILESGTDEEVARAFGTPQSGIAAEFRGPLWNRHTHLHETIHFWQALRFPFVYWNALYCWRFLLDRFVDTNRQTDDFHQWQLPLPRSLNFMSERICVHFSESKVVVNDNRHAIPGFRSMEPACALDLLETAVSYTQWKLASFFGESDEGTFSMWCKLNSSYPEMMRWLHAFLGDEDLALAMYLPLCSAAFETTNPVRAFAELAHAYARRHTTARMYHSVKIRKRIRKLLPTLSFSPAGPTDIELSDHSLLDIPFWWISLRQVVGLRFGLRDWPHPTLGGLAQRWSDEAVRHPEMCRVLELPDTISRETMTRCLTDYQPLFIVRYDCATRTRIIPYGDLSDFPIFSLIEQAAPGSSGSAAFVDLYTAFGAIRRASGALYAPDATLCPHVACPEHKDNYCNAWMFIHPRYQDCKFLEHFEYIRKSFRNAERMTVDSQHQSHSS
ncbi:hypothetical protein P3T43_003874 [Paraburkholderia sp. GAS41]|jgi:hypothetical protein|uniref:hypothetical protein n=1 Tax=Paraburkholderia sp. GAS41 TaxID=3035134 RepID=UPI003D1EE61A